jgi:hypothetical protein
VEKILPRESHRPTEFLKPPERGKLSSLQYPTTKSASKDANDVPSTEVAEEKERKVADNTDFENLNLDPRLRQALIKEQFTKPTPVQSKAIPLALEGKDILGKHRGSRYVLWFDAANEISPCEDRLWKDCGLCPPDFTDDPSEESCTLS